MNYQQVMDFLYERLPMYQRIGKVAIKHDLSNTIRFSEYLGHPDKKLKCIHIAGTNGKGSTAHLIASVLQAAGYNVGLYTSPHLQSFTERIRINGKALCEQFIVDFVNKNQQFIEEVSPSFFETTVVMAFDYFAQKNVDFAVIETGLGGRLDSTNIIFPVLSVITSISLDHEGILGDSITDMAREKAGIIKEKIPVVVGTVPIDAKCEILKIANEKNAPIIFCEKSEEVKYLSELSPNVIQLNLNTILSVCDIMGKHHIVLTQGHIASGIKYVVSNTGLKGRWQQLRKLPCVICDVGHNEEAVTWLMIEINKLSYQKLHIVWGMSADKSIEKILSLLIKEGIYYFCAADVPRALNANLLCQEAKEFGLRGKAYHSVSVAYEQALLVASPKDLIFVGGSTFVVAEIKDL